MTVHPDRFSLLSLPPLAASADDALRELFGFSSFRPGQARAIELVRSGRDGLIVMPTGAGKSLCYQLPAMIRPGLTLVISPLLALMKDQVDALRALDLPVTAVNSTLSDFERREEQRAIARGEYKLVYVAPERFRSPSFVDAIRQVEVGLVVVDEAHCVSQWGHDFRPDYLRIAELSRAVGNPQTVALTATATRAVQRDIAEQLCLRTPEIIVSGFERPNLFFQVVPTATEEDKQESLERILASYAGEPAIVYCSTRKQVEAVGRDLEYAGVASAIYHAGLPPRVRTATQDAWMNREFPVLVATNAFGMGVDRPDVRAIIHWSIPGSLEAYYQEAGRAGRDGKQASCVVLHSWGDRSIRDFFIENTFPMRHRIERLWGWLLDHQERLVVFNLEETARALGPPGDRLHPMGFRTALRLLARAGHIERYGTKKGFTDVLLADRCLPDRVRIDWKHHLKRRQIMEEQLQAMMSFVHEPACLQARLVRHFNAEPSFGDRCGHCSNCVPFAPWEGDREAPVSQELATTVRILLSAVARLEGRQTPDVIAAVLVGSRRRQVTDAQLDELTVHGLLKGKATHAQVVAMLGALERTRMVGRNDRARLVLTPFGVEVMTQRSPVWAPVAAAVSGEISQRYSPTGL